MNIALREETFIYIFKVFEDADSEIHVYLFILIYIFLPILYIYLSIYLSVYLTKQHSSLNNVLPTKNNVKNTLRTAKTGRS